MKKSMTKSSIRLRGNQALFAELGPVGFIRFMQQFVGRGDYTKDRENGLMRLIFLIWRRERIPRPGSRSGEWGEMV